MFGWLWQLPVLQILTRSASAWKPSKPKLGRLQDDVFGGPWQLCEASFEQSPAHDLRVDASGWFAAVLHCPECAAPLSPPALPPAQAPAPENAISPAHSPLSAVRPADHIFWPNFASYSCGALCLCR